MRKFLSKVLVVCLISLLIWGGSSVFLSAQEVKKITFYYDYGGGLGELEALKKIIAIFEEKNPGIKVELILAPAGQAWTKLLTMIASGDPPDATWFDDEPFQRFASEGLLLDITNRLRNSKVIKTTDYYPTAVKAYTWNGRWYALPNLGGSVVMFYNKTMFDKAGLKPPQGDKWTMEDFLKAATKLTKDENGDGVPETYGTGIRTWWAYWQSWIWRNKGSVLSPDKKRCVLDSPEAIEAMELYIGLRTKYKVAPSASVEKEQGSDMLFMSGKLAMWHNGSWALPNYRTIKDFEWDICLVPRWKTGSIERVSWDGYAIPFNSRNPDLGWKLIEFLGGGEGLKAFVEIGGLPPLKSVAESPLFLDTKGRPPKNIKAFVDALYGGRTRLTELVPQYDEMTTLLSQIFDEAFLGKKPVAQACKEAAIEVTKLLQKGK
ncbi:MAG: sugar ABC transporter substrate-binding protein [bacterium]|nr:sugar ABC transporter substrate-binding protein [bacterium]